MKVGRTTFRPIPVFYSQNEQFCTVTGAVRLLWPAGMEGGGGGTTYQGGGNDHFLDPEIAQNTLF